MSLFKNFGIHFGFVCTVDFFFFFALPLNFKVLHY